MFGRTPRNLTQTKKGFASSSCASILTRVPIEKKEIGTITELQRHAGSGRPHRMGYRRSKCLVTSVIAVGAVCSLSASAQNDEGA
jgi:hypothetical protein